MICSRNVRDNIQDQVLWSPITCTCWISVIDMSIFQPVGARGLEGVMLGWNELESVELRPPAVRWFNMTPFFYKLFSPARLLVHELGGLNSSCR